MTKPADNVLPSADFSADLAQLEAEGFRLDMIFPADEPRVAELTRNGRTVRLDATVSASSNSPTPPDQFVVTHGGAWGEGRAGMHYRDLIPDRHNGTVIASHIRIVEPGPVPDYVHHHDVDFQMIYCRRGRVEVVYEDQGDAFWMESGDCVLQPPHIRHRVLASDDGCEVIEIASPAEHPTFVEHEIELPNSTIDPDRDFGGQRFSFDRESETNWSQADGDWEERATGISAATNGLGRVRVLRPTASNAVLDGTHDGRLLMFFVLDGTATVTCQQSTNQFAADDSVAIPRGAPWQLTAETPQLRLLSIELR